MQYVLRACIYREIGNENVVISIKGRQLQRKKGKRWYLCNGGRRVVSSFSLLTFDCYGYTGDSLPLKMFSVYANGLEGKVHGEGPHVVVDEVERRSSRYQSLLVNFKIF